MSTLQKRMSTIGMPLNDVNLISARDAVMLEQLLKMMDEGMDMNLYRQLLSLFKVMRNAAHAIFKINSLAGNTRNKTMTDRYMDDISFLEDEQLKALEAITNIYVTILESK